MQAVQESSKIREAATSLQIIMSAAAPGFRDKLRGMFSPTKPNPVPEVTIDTILANMIKKILSNEPILDLLAFIEGLDKNYTTWLKNHSEVTLKLVKNKGLQEHAKRFDQLLREIKAEHGNGHSVIDLFAAPPVVKKSQPPVETAVSAWLENLPQLPVVDNAPQSQAVSISPEATNAAIPTAIEKISKGHKEHHITGEYNITDATLHEIGEELANYHITDASWREVDNTTVEHVKLVNVLHELMSESEDDEEQIAATPLPQIPEVDKKSSPKVGHWLADWLSSPVLATSHSENPAPNGIENIFKKMTEIERKKSNGTTSLPTPPNSNTPNL